MTKFAQGRFLPKNIAKYVGNKTPKYRSGWELAFMNFVDNNPAIINWASEAIFIPYRNPFTGKNTIYIPDFFLSYIDKNGKKHAEIIEVKPKRETTLEHAGRSKKAQAAAILNMAKWRAAHAFCKAHQMIFRVITEDQLFHQGKKR